MFNDFKKIDDQLQSRDPSDFNDDLIFVQCFNGILSPFWNSRIKSVISGLSHQTDPVELYRAS